VSDQLFEAPAPVAERPCAWCGALTVGTLEVEKARYGKAVNGVRVMKKAPVTAPCCGECSLRLAPGDQAGPEVV
jgi:hypothetical protein